MANMLGVEYMQKQSSKEDADLSQKKMQRYAEWLDKNKEGGQTQLAQAQPTPIAPQSPNPTVANTETPQWASGAQPSAPSAPTAQPTPQAKPATNPQLLNILRGVAQECEWYTNHRHARLGPFRQSDKITRKVYAQVPPGESETPLAKETVQYEREDIDGSYDTAAGVGVSGNSAADIGASLFGGEDTPVVDTPVDTPVADPVAPVKTEPAPSSASAPAENQPQAPDPSAPAVVPGQNSEATGLPKSWRKEMAPEWEKTSPAIKAYVQERESQMMRGINQYAGSANQWNTLVQPFAPLLQQYPDVNPVELICLPQVTPMPKAV